MGRGVFMKRRSGFSRLLLLVGCLTFISVDPAFSQDARLKPLIDGAKKEGKLQTYAILVVSDHLQIIQRFKEKYPFIEVGLWRSTGENIFNRVVTEARANAHLVDVIGTSGFQMYHLASQGLMQRYASPEARYYEAGFKDPEGHWTSYYVNPLVMVYNNKMVNAAQAPKSYEDLLDPKWKGQLVMEEDEVEWFATMSRYWGEEKTLHYLRRLASQNFHFRKGHTLMTTLVAAGEYPGAVLLYAPQTQFTKSQGAPIEWNPPNPTVVSLSLMGIAAKAPHPNAARLYLDHMLSEEIQRDYISGRFFKLSARAGVTSPVGQRLREVKLLPADITQAEHLEKHSKMFRDILLSGR